MAFSTIDKSTLYQNTVLYTGNGSTQSITGVGFQPDLNWIKCRSATENNNLVDSVRGDSPDASGYYVLVPNSDSEQTSGAYNVLVDAITSDGFDIGNNDQVNANTATFASWNWKAGTTTGIATNGSTTITPSAYSFNQTARMSIIAYTGNSTNDGQKVPHGLGVTPSFIIVKQLGGSGQWSCYNQSLGNTKAIALNDHAIAETDAGTGGYNFWYRTDPDSVNFTIGSSHYTNPTSTMIAYCFADVPGYSKFGSYYGNSSTDGSFIYTGFKPQFVLIKSATSANSWELRDNQRQYPYNLQTGTMYVNTNAIEDNGEGIDMLSNGFKCRASGNGQNGAQTYIYAAFGQPIISNSGICATAR